MITYNQDTLKNISLDFTGSAEELQTLIYLLEFDLKNSPNKGVGLSAIQINIPLRVAIIRHEKTVINLYNAKIIKMEQPFTFKQEGCLSIPGIFLDTKRYNIIEIRNGDSEILKLSGFIAVAVQHEICHWFGQTLYDYQV